MRGDLERAWVQFESPRGDLLDKKNHTYLLWERGMEERHGSSLSLGENSFNFLFLCLIF